jgi:hypothetical protein
MRASQQIGEAPFFGAGKISTLFGEWKIAAA